MLLHGVKPVGKGKKLSKSEWTPIETSRKLLSRSDAYVLGHPDVGMPAVIARSSIKGVKGRLVTLQGGVIKSKTPNIDASKFTKVVKEFEFSEDQEQLPIYFETPTTFTSAVWVEMENPTKEDAIVSAYIHGVIKSKR